LAALNQRLLNQSMNALEPLDAIERPHPNHSLVFQERGHCHFASGRAAHAIESFERAVELNPALASSWEMLKQLLSVASEPAAKRKRVTSQHLRS
jgi:predicted Zn-dependent protease